MHQYTIQVLIAYCIINKSIFCMFLLDSLESSFAKNQGCKRQISSYQGHTDVTKSKNTEPSCPYVIAKFFQGGYRTKMKIWSDRNEKLVGKFFARLRRAKKGVPKFFACGGLFSSWRH